MVSLENWRDVQDVGMALSGSQPDRLGAWIIWSAFTSKFGCGSPSGLLPTSFECSGVHGENAEAPTKRCFWLQLYRLAVRVAGSSSGWLRHGEPSQVAHLPQISVSFGL